MVNILFSLNRYDYEGDITDEGVFLHFGDTSVKICNDIDEFDDVCKQMEKIRKELKGETE